MATTTFALVMEDYVDEALARACAPDRASDLVDAACARVAAFVPPDAKVSRDGTAIAVVHPEIPPEEIAARAVAIEQAASAAPYPFGGRHVFLPLPCAGVATGDGEPFSAAIGRAKQACRDARRVWAAIVWGGSIEASRLVLFSGSARVGGDATCTIRIGAVDAPVALVEQRGHHIYCRPEPSAEGLLFHGRTLAAPRRFYGPKLLFVPPRGAGREASVVVLFDGASQTPFFGRPTTWEGDERDDNAWALTALAAAARAEAGPYGLVLVRAVGADAEELHHVASELARVDANVRRDVSIADETIAVVAQGARDALVVYGDAVREHLGRRTDVAIADVVAEPSEAPRALWRRALEQLNAARA